MVSLRRNKTKFYICKKIKGSTQYEKPIKVFVNVQPTNSVGEMLALGEDYTMFLNIKCSKNDSNMFNIGDKCYVHNPKPKEHDVMCEGADYVVDNEPLVTFNVAEIKLRKLSGKNETNQA